MNPQYLRIYAVVRRIPRGKVATYGQVARMAGLPGRARLVGRALSRLPDASNVPWHRVINARQQISDRSDPESRMAQQLRLAREGVAVTRNGRISLTRFGWTPVPSRRSRPEGGSHSPNPGCSPSE